MSDEIIFMGTPEFAAVHLSRLIKEDYRITLVVTQPDRPVGRGRKLKPSPVKVIAQEAGLKVSEPEKIRNREFMSLMERYEPDYLVVAAYGKILPRRILQIPRKIPVNMHPSLLPKYRGPSPAAFTIINGDEYGGITTMLMTPRMDAGDILLQRKVRIKERENAEELELRLAELGADLLVETLDKYSVGLIEPRKQDEDKAIYVPLLTKAHGLIDWEKSAEKIENFVYGMNPWPGAYSFLNGRRIAIIEAEAFPEEEEEEDEVRSPGDAVRLNDKRNFWVKTGDGLLRLDNIKPENSRRMEAAAFLRGLQDKTDLRFSQKR